MSLNHDFSKEELLKTYRSMAESDASMQRCVVSGVRYPKDNLQRHHPCGRSGTNLLRYVYIRADHHRFAHDHPKWATEHGLLWPRRNTRSITDAEWEELKIKMKETLNPWLREELD